MYIFRVPNFNNILYIIINRIRILRLIKELQHYSFEL